MFDEQPVPRFQSTSNKALDPPAGAAAGQRQRYPANAKSMRPLD